MLSQLPSLRLVGGIFTGLLWGCAVGWDTANVSAIGFPDSQDASKVTMPAKSAASLGNRGIALAAGFGFIFEVYISD